MLQNRFSTFIIWTVLSFVMAGTGGIHAAPASSPLAGQIRSRIDSERRLFLPGNSGLHNRQLVRRFYKLRNFRPAWITQSGKDPHVEEMLKAIRHSRFEGLDPADYHIGPVSRILSRLSRDIPDSTRLKLQVDLELALTDAFLRLGRHLHQGKLNSPNHGVEIPDNLYLEGLNQVVVSGKIFAALDDLNTANSRYLSLRQALGRYLRIAKKGGWKSIPRGKELKKGDHDSRLPQLVERLVLTDDLSKRAVKPFLEKGRPLVFNGAIESAVLRFQGRHGLIKNGRLNWRTRLAMNVPLKKRILQIRLNMDLRRGFPDGVGDRSLIVNIPAMELQAIQAGNTVLKMRVIVGRPEQKTPVFSDFIPYLVINPYWYIPPEIAFKEIVPSILHNPKYLAVRGIRLFRKMSADKEEIDPDTIDWRTIVPEEIDFYFRQDPGWDNSLGSVKFIIPNRKHIYLHDTPSRKLFRRRIRALSFGCVRVELPLDLASFVLADRTDWSKSKIRDLINSGHQRKITLPAPLLIQVVYWTVRVDSRGRLIFLPDIYDLEPDLITRLIG